MPDSDTLTQPADSANGNGARPSGRSVVFNDNYEIFFDNAQPRFHQPGVKVYQARNNVRNLGCLAYVCDRSVIPRVQTAEKYSGLQSLSVARLMSHGVVTCPDGFQRYTFVYENNFGRPIVPGQGEPEAYNWRVDQVLSTVIRPLALTLQEMHNTDQVHGGLRVHNLFDGGTKPMERVIIGDCLAQSYAGAQTALTLPVEKAIAQPCGRGYGDRADDMYALGIICAILLRTKDPLFGKNDLQIITAKMEQGTFLSMLDNERLPGNMIELLRGLLQDETELRWSIEDVMEWLDGRRVNPRQGRRRLKASRHIKFNNEEILIPGILAIHFNEDPLAAAKTIESGELETWVTRSISDTRLDERLGSANETSREYGTGAGFQDRLVTRACAALEPTFPILCRSVKVFPDSIGNVMADLVFQNKDVKPLTDMILQQMVTFWMNMQPEYPSDATIILGRYEQCQQFLKQRAIGYGLERCLYFLCPEVPCLSEKLRGFYVRNPEDLLFALNTLGDSPNRPENLFDRHIVAFLSIRDRKIIDTSMPDLNSPEKYRQIIGAVKTIAAIQTRSRIPQLSSLTKWIQSYVEPIFDRYHDRDLRASLRKKMSDLKEGGSVGKVADLLLNTDMARRDQIEFRYAMNEYYQMRLEEQQISQSLERDANFGTQSGQEIAALLAGIMMALVVVGFIIIRLTQGGMGW